jgi:hypothetical protein
MGHNTYVLVLYTLASSGSPAEQTHHLQDEMRLARSIADRGIGS